MAFALGFAGGFADTAVIEPEPPPVGGGGGTSWVQGGAPAPHRPSPRHLHVAFHANYRWAATVVSVAPAARFTSPPGQVSSVPAVITAPTRILTVTPTLTATFVSATVTDPVVLRRFAEDVELAEIMMALGAP